MSSSIPTAPRIAWLDTPRVAACLLVILCHCTEGYVPGDGMFTMDTAAALFLG